jgi:hypothetical protein
MTQFLDDAPVALLPTVDRAQAKERTMLATQLPHPNAYRHDQLLETRYRKSREGHGMRIVSSSFPEGLDVP